jgi:hypothetical protein
MFSRPSFSSSSSPFPSPSSIVSLSPPPPSLLLQKNRRGKTIPLYPSKFLVGTDPVTKDKQEKTKFNDIYTHVYPGKIVRRNELSQRAVSQFKLKNHL